MTFDRLDSTGYMLNLCARLIALRMAQALRPLGVAPAQLPVLFTLSALGESTQTELAERAGIEQPTMALLLRRMERDDLIERTADNTAHGTCKTDPAGDRNDRDGHQSPSRRRALQR